MTDMDDITTIDGMDDALIGIGSRCGQPDLAVYDVEMIIQILMERDGMSRDDAIEFHYFNIEGAWVGETTPIFVHTIGDTP